MGRTKWVKQVEVFLLQLLDLYVAITFAIIGNVRAMSGSAKGGQEESPDCLCLREYDHRVPIFRNIPGKA